MPGQTLLVKGGYQVCVAAVRSQARRRVAIDVNVVKIGIVLKKKPCNVKVAAVGTHAQRRSAPLISAVDVDAEVDELGNLVEVAVAGRFDDGFILDYHCCSMRPTSVRFLNLLVVRDFNIVVLPVFSRRDARLAAAVSANMRCLHQHKLP